MKKERGREREKKEQEEEEHSESTFFICFHCHTLNNRNGATSNEAGVISFFRLWRIAG